MGRSAKEADDAYFGLWSIIANLTVYQVVKPSSLSCIYKTLLSSLQQELSDHCDDDESKVLQIEDNELDSYLHHQSKEEKKGVQPHLRIRTCFITQTTKDDKQTTQSLAPFVYSHY